MPHRLGYACINTRLAAEGVQTSRGMIRRTFDAKGVPHASALALQNAQDLLRVVQWNADHGVRVFRITSCLVPWASEFELEEMPDYEAFKGALARCGELAVATGQRLSFHPGPFNCLAAESERVVQNSIRDLRYHGEVCDLLGLPRSPQSKINIHLGGRLGDGERAIERFAKEFPGRFYNSGIAEQGMVGIAAGMALGGLKPIVYHMPNFLAFRAIEQVRNDVVMQGLPVKFIATGVDDYFKFLGQSHCCGQQDAEIMKMVGMRVHDPYRDGLPFDELVSRWVGDESPAYLRV
jgi:hypothetical protein